MRGRPRIGRVGSFIFRAACLCFVTVAHPRLLRGKFARSKPPAAGRTFGRGTRLGLGPPKAELNLWRIPTFPVGIAILLRRRGYLWIPFPGAVYFAPVSFGNYLSRHQSGGRYVFTARIYRS